MLITKFTASNYKFTDYIENPENRIIFDQDLRNTFIDALKEVSRSQELIFRAKYSSGKDLVILQVWKDKDARTRFESLYDHEKILAAFPKEWNWSLSEEEVDSIDIETLEKDVIKYPHYIIQVNANNRIYI